MNNRTPAPDISEYLARPSEAELELLKLHSPDEPLVIFDIGACEGEDSVRYSKRFPRARLFTFEPLPANQALVHENFARHDVTRAELIPLALSDHSGSARFHVSSGRPPDEFAGKDWNYGNKSSSLLAPAAAEPMFGWVEFTETITVPTQSLDEFCRQRGVDRIDFVHMDVQGAEGLVLAGARQTLPQIGAVWLEVANQALYQGQKLRPEIERLMHEAGFELGLAVERGEEGDQFYVNRRFGRSRRYLARRRILAWWRRARFFLGRVRRGQWRR